MGFSISRLNPLGALKGNFIGGALGGALFGGAGALAGAAAGTVIGSEGFGQDSGQGTTDKSLQEVLGFTEDDLVDFKKVSGNESFDTGNLKNGFARFDNATGTFLGYSGDSTKSMAEKFISWTNARKQSASEHEAYVNLTKNSPGRQATIIVPSTAKDSVLPTGALG